MTSVSPSKARIAIIGAGPGGLTCARVLQLNGFEVTVLDRDESAGDHRAGSTLDMQLDTGQVALREAGLFEEFLSIARPEDQGATIMNRFGEIVHRFEADSSKLLKPEIDRAQLRTLLLDSLQPGTVRFGSRVERVEELGEGKLSLVLAAGERADYDLVIGADGAFSQVRSLLSDVVPEYTGVTFVEAQFHDVPRQHPGLEQLVSNGNTYARGDNKALLAQRNSNDHIRVFIGVRMPLDWHEQHGVDLEDTGAVRRYLLDQFDGWHEDLLDMIRDNQGSYWNRPIFALPLPYGWNRRSGVTLIGDSAHVMSPFGGHGANLAMLDGADLALALTRAATVDEAIASYEDEAIARATPRGEQAANGVQSFFRPGDVIPPPPVVEHEKAMLAGAEERRLRDARR